MKRGQRATHRVRWEWSNGVKGTKTFMSLQEAEWYNDDLVDRAYNRDMTVEVTIEAIAP